MKKLFNKLPKGLQVAAPFIGFFVFGSLLIGGIIYLINNF